MEDWERQARKDALEGIKVRVRAADALRLAALVPKPAKSEPPPETKDESHLEALASLMPEPAEKG